MEPSKIQFNFKQWLVDGEVFEMDDIIINEIKGDVKGDFKWDGVEEIKDEIDEQPNFEKIKSEDEKNKKQIEISCKSGIGWFDDVIDRNVNKFGSVFLKVNGKALIDAEWMKGDLCVRNGNEGMMLLQASERVQQLIERDEKEGKKTELEIRKYLDLRISDEFRCFVINKELVIISQRYNDAYDAKIKERKNEIIKKTLQLFNEIKQIPFIDNYTFDIVLDSSVQILGFDEVNERSFEGMTFNYEELMLNAKDNTIEKPLMKYVEDSQHIVPSIKQFYGIPEEFYDDKVFNTFLTNPSQLNDLH